MDSDLSQAFQEELKCFICLSSLTDPVTISCGHSFCRACLHLSWEDSQPPVHCPMCRQPSQQKDFRTNIVLKKLVSIARQESLRKVLSSEEQKCVTHRETRRIFCAEKRICLCPLCSDSHDRSHCHSTIELAAEAQRERLLKQMARVWEKIQDNQETIETEKRIVTLLKDYLTLREDMVRTEYRKLHPVLCGEEEQHVESMRNESRCVLEKLRNNEALMVQDSKQLREIYQELMQMSQESYLVLLQGSDDILGRSESMQLNMDQTMKPELTALPITGLTERFNKFKADIDFKYITIFLANKKLFDVLRRFSIRPHHKDSSMDSTGFHLASWGSQNFNSGKYYWERDLGSCLEWAVGVCKDSWLGHRNELIEPEGAFLLVCVKDGNHYSLLSTCPIFLHFIEKPLGRVGVLFDCEDGCVSFLDVAKSSLIY
ncbi:tripartite motif-containing protein 43-like, partial [Sigmodon hispidus]